MLERAYLPPRQGLNRVLDVRDWFARTYTRRSARRLIASVVVSFAAIAVSLYCIGKANATPTVTDAQVQYAECDTLDKFGVSDRSTFEIIDHLVVKYGFTKPHAVLLVDGAIRNVCPQHLPAYNEWLQSPRGTYSPDKVFGGHESNGAPVMTGVLA